MKIRLRTHVSRFWAAYFVVRIIYLLFAVLVYGRMTTLGDTERYLSAGFQFSPEIFYNSTRFMDFVGGISGQLFGGNNPLSNFPFMLLSFFAVRWVVRRCGFDRDINPYLMFILISLPNFCIWTSICSKETFGLVFSSILAYWLINFLRRDFAFRKVYLLGIYLCALFKPQYLPFICQALLFIYWGYKVKTKLSNLLLILLFVAVNLFILYAISDIVNAVAPTMYLHFALDSAESSKNLELFDQPYSFYYHAPLGMLEGFFGPTPSEMARKPLHLLAGFESAVLAGLLLWLLWDVIRRTVIDLKFHTVVVPGVFLLFTGLMFIHYPFGIFNAGSAIRYRTNFMMILILVALELYRQYRSLRLSRSAS